MPDPAAAPHVDTALARAAWNYDLACTGLTPQPGGALDDVTWVVVHTGSLYVGHFSHAIGLWVYPDTIVIEADAVRTPWVLAHELLHHLLRGPPPDQGGPHPWTPFAFPCQLMGFQHAAAGIMGGSGSQLSSTR